MFFHLFILLLAIFHVRQKSLLAIQTSTEIQPFQIFFRKLLQSNRDQMTTITTLWGFTDQTTQIPWRHPSQSLLFPPFPHSIAQRALPNFRQQTNVVPLGQSVNSPFVLCAPSGVCRVSTIPAILSSLIELFRCEVMKYNGYSTSKQHLSSILCVGLFDYYPLLNFTMRLCSN
jgi:hypothetical protein